MRCARRPSCSRPASSGSSSTISTRMEKESRYNSIMAGINIPLYDPRLVQPMRGELTRLGFRELRSPEEVDAALGTARDTTLVVVNSVRSEEHTSELQSQSNLVCRLLLEKKKKHEEAAPESTHAPR